MISITSPLEIAPPFYLMRMDVPPYSPLDDLYDPIEEVTGKVLVPSGEGEYSRIVSLTGSAGG